MVTDPRGSYSGISEGLLAYNFCVQLEEHLVSEIHCRLLYPFSDSNIQEPPLNQHQHNSQKLLTPTKLQHLRTKSALISHSIPMHVVSAIFESIMRILIIIQQSMCMMILYLNCWYVRPQARACVRERERA